MRNISNLIEHYLKHILLESSGGDVEIQRNELAEQFSCAPSQINYVLSTRFTLEKGYIVKSKRGGGGYIRIQRINLPAHQTIHNHLCESVGERLEQSTAEGLILQLEEAARISHREANLLRAAVSRDNLAVKFPYRDEMRARLFKSMLLALLGK